MVSALTYAAPFLWNHLPNTVRTAPSYLTFRKNPKIFFYSSISYTDCLPCSNLTHLFLTMLCTTDVSLSGQIGFELCLLGDLATCKLKKNIVIIIIIYMHEYIKSLCTLNRCKYFDPKFKLLLQSAFYACN